MRKLLDLVRKLLGQSSSEKGFTLIELLVVIAILGVLLVGSIVAINPSQKINQAKDATAKGGVDQMASALQSYFTQNQTYPTAAQGLAQLKTAGEINSVPTAPDGSALGYKATASCTGAAGAYCTDAAVYFTLQQASGTNTVWCWQSSTGKAQAVTNAAACTAP